MTAPGPFGLADAQFWTAPYATKDAVRGKLLTDDFRGTLIDAPRQVAVTERDTLPLVGCWVATEAEVRSEPFERRAVVASVRLEDDRVFVDRLNEPRVRDDRKAPPAPPNSAGSDGDDDEAVFAHMFTADVRQRLALPWRESTLLTTLLHGKRASNRVRTVLGPSATAWVDPEVARVKAEAAAETWPEPVDPPPGDPLPSYRRAPEGPPVPDGAGVKLRALPRRITLSSAARAVVRGVFRAPVAPRHLVRPKPDDPAWSAGDPAATAIVPVTLVLLGGEAAPGPWVLDLRVPCHEKPAQGHVVGHFGLDLLQTVLKHRAPQPYVMYALVGELLSEPLELELVKV